VPSSPQGDAEIVNMRADARGRRSGPSPDPRADDDSTSSEVGWGGGSRPEGRAPRRNHGNRVRHGSEQPHHGHLTFGGCGDEEVRGSVCLGAERPPRLAPPKVSPTLCHRSKAAREQGSKGAGGRTAVAPFLPLCLSALLPSLRRRAAGPLVSAEKTAAAVFPGAAFLPCCPTKNIVNPQHNYPMVLPCPSAPSITGTGSPR